MEGKSVVVVGGGAAGMEAAGQLAKAGARVTIVEKESETGGHVSKWCYLFPDRRKSTEVIQYLNSQINQKNITLLTGEEVNLVEKKGGRFILTTSNGKELDADAVVLATGFDLFRSERKEEYGYGIYENVITSADLEVMFKKGEIRLTNGGVPQKIGFIHCVGSRDEKVGNLYCSKLCCVTAVKQAIEIKEFLKEARIFCFYMDMRMGGALYEELYHEAQVKHGISFIRGKVSEVSQTIDHRLVVKAEDTLAGRPLRMEIDMLVLMAGMEMSQGGKRIAQNSRIKTGENRFFLPADHHFGGNKSNVRGIYFAGACAAPMNITETISHARSAVQDVITYLSDGKQ
ncbi:MAG: CoB--CoM heterodisulfide reductase iron-sulfur subunit A family protein [Bacteroidales bacterium]|nr:CoB--CoM heterodisulfide reductase iron-sulfur subunit A family protein [Bacteroidales bacterium]